MRNLPILLLSVCWSLGRVSHPALTRGGTVKLAPPDRGRGDPYGGACAVPGGLAAPLQLPRSPKRRAQPQQVRRLRPRRTPGASESRRSRSPGVPGKRGCRREGASAPGGIPCPSPLRRSPGPLRQRRAGRRRRWRGAALQPRALLGGRDGSAPAGQRGPGPVPMPVVIPGPRSRQSGAGAVCRRITCSPLFFPATGGH